MNADGLVSTGQGLLGSNMFAYCLNNPVVYGDHMGSAAKNQLQRMLYGDGVEIVDSAPQKKNFWNRVGDWCVDAYNAVVDTCNAVIDFVTNTDEATTQANLQKYGFSFYNDTLVVCIPLIVDKSAFSYGIIVMDDSYRETSVLVNDFSNTLKHEYGHKLHLEEIGYINYTFQVALPSLTCAALSEHCDWIRNNYYNLPWERTADKLADIDRDHAAWSNTLGALYYLVTKLTSTRGCFILD